MKRKVEVNPNGHLLWGGCDTVELAQKYGTPLYVMDAGFMRQRMRQCRSAMEKCFKNGQVFYASKAFLTTAVCRMAEQEGINIDVASGGELYLALKAGIDGSSIAFHGNVKTDAELKMAIENNVEIVIDGPDEIGLIAAVAQALNKKARVFIRVTPGVEAHTHHYIMTGTLDCKFAMGIENGMAIDAVKNILSFEELDFEGIHCHIGSQIMDPKPFRLAAQRMAAFALEIKRETGCYVRAITMGGGFGVRYIDGDDELAVEHYVNELYRGLSETFEKAGVEMPVVSIEPGRFIVGNAGITLYTAYGRKVVPGVRTFLSVDGGMADNPRPMLYQAKYEAMIAQRPLAQAEETVHIAGRCCESGDVLIEDIEMPKVEIGETIAVFTTGAYNYSMASNYNKLPHPAVVFVENGMHGLAVRRQSYDNLIMLDEIPSFIEG